MGQTCHAAPAIAVMCSCCLLPLAVGQDQPGGSAAVSHTTSVGCNSSDAMTFHARHHHTAACGTYSGMFLPIERTIEAVTAHALKGITQALMQSTVDAAQARRGFAHVKVHNNAVYIGSFKMGFQTRLQAMLLMINDAVRSCPYRLPNTEFVLNTEDASFDQLGAWNIMGRKAYRASFLAPSFPVGVCKRCSGCGMAYLGDGVQKTHPLEACSFCSCGDVAALEVRHAVTC